jgi:hypothetical protein
VITLEDPKSRNVVKLLLLIVNLYEVKFVFDVVPSFAPDPADATSTRPIIVNPSVLVQSPDCPTVKGENIPPDIAALLWNTRKIWELR